MLETTRSLSQICFPQDPIGIPCISLWDPRLEIKAEGSATRHIPFQQVLTACFNDLSKLLSLLKFEAGNNIWLGIQNGPP